MAKERKLRVTQTKSQIGNPQTIRRVLKGLGLGRIGKSVEVDNTPSFRGQIKKVIHLVRVEEVENGKSREIIAG